MHLRTKQRLAVAGLALFAVWPLVHRGLVARYEIDPWRFFGWSMYCVPTLPVRLEIVTVQDGAPPPVDRDAPSARRAEAAEEQFIRQRRSWGRLVRPVALAALVLDAQPHATAVEITVHRLHLDRRSARLVSTPTRYAYTRGAGAATAATPRPG